MRKNLELFTVITLFSIGAFLGAFLLFEIEPMIGKYVLPEFGGTSEVWICALLFFQAAVLLGYLFVFLLSRLRVVYQIILYVILLAVLVGYFAYSLSHAQVVIFPDVTNLPHISPLGQILWILTTAIALPYCLLAMTSVIFQKWFGFIRTDKSPYWLYAISNTASLIAVISYPFFIEPRLPLAAQGRIWMIGFIFFGICVMIACGVVLVILREKHPVSNTNSLPRGYSSRHLLLWVLLPAISSVMLLSITNILTEEIAPIPFLWLLPLGLYLLSFIVCFSKNNWYRQNLFAYLFLITGFFALVFTRTDMPSVWIGIVVYAFTLLSSCMLCHGQLYRLRPEKESLDMYYLAIACGSVLGAVGVAVVAPIIFRGLWEVYIGFYLTFLLTLVVLLHQTKSFGMKWLRYLAGSDREIFIAGAIGFPFVLCGTGIMLQFLSGYSSVKTWRSFYGILTVSKRSVNGVSATYLKYDNTIHGDQFSGKYQSLPTTYYTHGSGIGLVLDNYKRPVRGLHIGIIGLGTGTLAAYGKKGDMLTFYELNPQVAYIAKTQFSYIKNSPANIRIVLGDGRLSLQNELSENKAEKYDILIVDAFSDDAIPIQLLTKEAFAMYLRRIYLPEGILAFHISNNYIDLKPVLVAMAKEFNLSFVFIKTPAGGIATQAEWAILTYNHQFLTTPSIRSAAEGGNATIKSVGVWTDQYSNLFEVLK